MAEIHYEKVSQSHTSENTKISEITSQDTSEETQAFFGTLKPFWGRALLYVVLLFVSVALAWAWQCEVDVVASAPFRLIPMGYMQSVQAPRNGEIETIAIKEGDRVTKGQVLFKFRSWETWQDLRELEQAEVALQKAAYDFNQTLPQKNKLSRETLSALEKQLHVLEAVQAAHNEALISYQNMGNSKNATVLQTQIGFRNAEIEHLKQQFLQQKTLFERRLISRTDMDRARVQYLGALAALPNRMAEIYKQEITVQNLKRQILETRTHMEHESAQITYAYQTAKLRRNQAHQKADRTLESESDLVLAPRDGLVTQVLSHTPGQIVNKGQPIVTLAPSSAPTVAEILISNKDVGLLKVGQEVKLKYDAFAFQDFGIKQGWLTQISPDAILDEHLGPSFRGIVDLAHTHIQVKGIAKPLRYGMKGTAEIITNRQSILLILLSPLRQLYESATYHPDTKLVTHSDRN